MIDIVRDLFRWLILSLRMKGKMNDICREGMVFRGE